MASFKISGQMKVKTLKQSFKDYFGSTLRIYEKNHFADDDKTLAAIRDTNAKGGEFECGDQDAVGDFEKFMKELYGIKVQVASPDNAQLVDDNMKLGDVKNVADRKKLGARKKSKFIFNGNEYTVKGRLCHGVIKYYTEQHPEARIGDLQELFHVHSKDQAVMLKEDAKNVPDYKGVTGKSYYLDSSDDIEIRGGIASVWNYWPEKYFSAFMNIAKKLGYDIEVVDLDKNDEGNIDQDDKPMKTLTVNLHARGVYEFDFCTFDDVESVRNARSNNDDYDGFSDELNSLLYEDDDPCFDECPYIIGSVDGVSVDDEDWNTIFESNDKIEEVHESEVCNIDEEYADMKNCSILSSVGEGDYVVQLTDVGSCDIPFEIEIPEDEDFDIKKLKVIRNSSDHLDICNHYDDFDGFLSAEYIIYDGKVYYSGFNELDSCGSQYYDCVEIKNNKDDSNRWTMETATDYKYADEEKNEDEKNDCKFASKYPNLDKNFHDIDDCLSIGLYDKNLHPIDGESTNKFATDVEAKLKEVSEDWRDEGCHGLDPETEVNGNRIDFNYTFSPLGDNLRNKVGMLLKTCIDCAKAYGYNIFSKVMLTATYQGNCINLWEYAILVNDNLSRFEAAYLENPDSDDDDDTRWMVDDDEITSELDRREFTTDGITDEWEDEFSNLEGIDKDSAEYEDFISKIIELLLDFA